MTTRSEKKIRISTNKDILSGSKAPRQKNYEQDYRSIADSSVDLLWTMDCHGVISCISLSLKQLLRYKPEERFDRSINDTLMTPESHAYARRMFDRAISGKLDVFNGHDQ